MCELFNACLRLYYFPYLWKIAKIIIVPTPQEPYIVPEKYKPFSHLSVISKVFERILHIHVAPLVGIFFLKEQFVLIREQSTTLQIIRLVTCLAEPLMEIFLHQLYCSV